VSPIRERSPANGDGRVHPQIRRAIRAADDDSGGAAAWRPSTGDQQARTETSIHREKSNEAEAFHQSPPSGEPSPQPEGPPTPPTALTGWPRRRGHRDEAETAEGEIAGGSGELARIASALERIAQAVEKQAASAVSAVEPAALSKADAARFLGVTEQTVEQLIRTRKLAYAKVGSQRGRVLAVEDLRAFVPANRQPTGEEMTKARKRR
jgi:excisionase family DNA binding protein